MSEIAKLQHVSQLQLFLAGMAVALPHSMRVKLTRKLADRLDGIDVASCKVGDVLDLPLQDAQLLIAEQWAQPEKPDDARSRARRVLHLPRAS